MVRAITVSGRVQSVPPPGYSRKFSDRFSAGAAIRYIYSGLTSGQVTSDSSRTFPGRSVALDLACYYRKEFAWGSVPGLGSLGANISNIGTPVS